MKIVRSIARDPSCSGGWDCPSVHELEDGSALMHGNHATVDAQGTVHVADHEDSVVLPAGLMRALREGSWI